MRPSNCDHRRVFVNYQAGKCTKQPVGVDTFGKIPSKIATYLQPPNLATYTSHCFRRTSATLLMDAGGDITNLKRHGGWKSTTVAEGENSFSIKLDIAKKAFGGQKNVVNDDGS